MLKVVFMHIRILQMETAFAIGLSEEEEINFKERVAYLSLNANPLEPIDNLTTDFKFSPVSH